MGLMTNFLSLKEMFRISLHGNPIFGVSLKEKQQEIWSLKMYEHFFNIIKKIMSKTATSGQQRKTLSPSALKTIKLADPSNFCGVNWHALTWAGALWAHNYIIHLWNDPHCKQESRLYFSLPRGKRPKKTTLWFTLF